MIKTLNITKIIGVTTLLFSLSMQNAYADRISSTTKEGITTLEIGCVVTVQKPTCNTDEKHILPAANDYGNFTLQPNETLEISIINPNSKKIGFLADVEVKGYISDDKGKDNIVTISTLRSISNFASQTPVIVKNNFSKKVKVFITVNNLIIDTSPSLMKKAQIKVLAKTSFQENYTTKDQWEKNMPEAIKTAKEYGFPQPYGCTVNVVNEQCIVPFMYPLKRGESVNVIINFDSNLPKNAKADWQLSGIYYDNGNAIATTLSTVQTSHKNEVKTFRNNTGTTLYVSPKIINFMHKDALTTKSQVTINFVPDFKK